MNPENKRLRDIQVAARKEAEVEIVWKLLGEDHKTGTHVRVSDSGHIEVNLKYLKAQLSFLSEGVIQKAIYTLQERQKIRVNKSHSGTQSATKWYSIK